MRRTKVTFDIVREIGLALPDVEDSTMYGSLALKVRGKLLTCMAIHKSAEPGSLAVRIDFEQRSGLLEEAPETYYLTDHYRNYPVVLVRLSRIQLGQLRDLLGASWRFVSKRQPSRNTWVPTRSSCEPDSHRMVRSSGLPGTLMEKDSPGSRTISIEIAVRTGRT